MDEPHPHPFARIARRITWIAWTLLAAAAVAFVWAIAFTKGVEALINVLLISLLGFLVPSLFVFWVAWVISEFEPVDARGERRDPGAGAAVSADRRPWQRYLFAIATVALAAGGRALLLPVLGYTQPFPTFYLAVAAAAWYGGMGPAVLANALSIAAVWFWFVPPTWSLEIGRVGDIVGIGLFFAISITIAGMTSGLRVVRRQAGALGSELLASEARLRAIAEEAPAMIWMTDAEGRCVYVNRTALDFTGRSLEHHLQRGWIDNLHPDDVEKTLHAQRLAAERHEGCSTRARVRCRDGTYRVVHETARARFDAEGRFLGCIGAAVEIESAPTRQTAH